MRRGPALVVCALAVVAGLACQIGAAPAAQAKAKPTTTTTTKPAPTTTAPPSNVPPPGTALPGLPNSALVATAPPNVDESTRLAAVAQLKAAADVLAAARKEEADATKALADLDAKVAALNARRAALAVEEQQLATQLEATRDRLRKVALAQYVTGGAEALATAVGRADSISGFGRDRVYGTRLLETQRAAFTGYRDALAKATATTAQLGREADRAQADQVLARQRIEGAAQRRLAKEAEYAQVESFANLITAAAPVLPSDIPTLVLTAYVRGAAAASRRWPACRLHWSALAGIGRIESGHGRSGGASLTIAGDVIPRILGPRLDGTQFALINDTDAGVLDGDPVFDRAVGPMQFIPGTWRSLGEDGNGDGIPDPNNIYDAAVAAGMYLCRGRAGLDQEPNLAPALFAYNHSDAYVAKVLSSARDYASLGLPGVPPSPYAPPAPAPASAQAAP